MVWESFLIAAAALGLTRARACVRGRVRACVRVCVHVGVCVFVEDMAKQPAVQLLAPNAAVDRASAAAGPSEAEPGAASASAG